MKLAIAAMWLLATACGSADERVGAYSEAISTCHCCCPADGGVHDGGTRDGGPSLSCCPPGMRACEVVDCSFGNY
jgi:hypothetical protein